MDLNDVASAVGQLEEAVSLLREDPCELTAENVCLASRGAWALFLPAYTEFAIYNAELVHDFRKSLALAAEHVRRVHPPTENTLQYAENIQRRALTLDALISGDLLTVRHLLEEAIFTKKGKLYTAQIASAANAD